MANPIYKQFVPCRTAIYALAMAVFLGFCNAAAAETNPAYTVEGVEVDVTDQNAVKAREKAMDEAQVKAYMMLAARLIGEEQAAALPPPDPITASSLVQDFEVMKEQVSKVRYKGVYTVRFRPTAVRAYMAGRGKAYSDTVQKPTMVLPYFQSGGRTYLWDETNPWMNAWRAQSATTDMMKPVIVPLGDADDMAQVGGEGALEIDPMSVQRLAQRYNAEDVAILLAATEPTQSAQGRLAVNIYNNGFEGPVFVQKLVVDQLPNETDDAVYARAVAQVKVLLRQNWKANAAYSAQAQAQVQTPPPVQNPYAPRPQTQPYAGAAGYTRPALGPSTLYTVTARFSSVQEWVRMKNTMDRLYGMQAVMVKGLKSREAALDLRYAGNMSALQLGLQNAGLSLRSAPGGGLEISTGAASPGVYGR